MKRCYYCDREAVVLCDHLSHDGERTNICSRPICEQHRRQVGTLRACDRSRRTKNNQSHTDTIDHCTEHPK